MPQVIFTEDFNAGLDDWFFEGGRVYHEIGDFGSNWNDAPVGNCSINVVGTSDHSGLTFDADGFEVPAEGQGYVSIGSGSMPGVKLSTTIQVYRGLSYRIYFRFSGSHREGHSITGAFSIGDQVVKSEVLDAPDEEWKSGSFTFTPNISGMAQLTFDDSMTIYPENSDLLLDSVVVTAVPVAATD